jgi:DNA topoisomerase-2
MSITGKPIIEKSKESFTKVTYKPDLTRLNVLHIYEDVYSIMLKRTLDIAAYNPDIKIYFNEKLIPINSLTDYAKMHIGNEQELFYEKLNDR